MQVREDSFFFNDTATTEIYTLSLHDALPISARARRAGAARWCRAGSRSSRRARSRPRRPGPARAPDRKSTRLNSSHANISYAVFCLKIKTISTLRELLAALSHADAACFQALL